MQWLTISYFILAGLNLSRAAAIETPEATIFWNAPNNSIETTLGAELLFAEHVFLSASVKTNEVHLSGVAFAPFLGEYNVKAGVRFGGLEVGYVDDCTHPILTKPPVSSSTFYEGWSGFYVSFKGSARLF